jgi:hypothetical protein
MNKWKTVWDAYMVSASRARLFSDVIKYASYKDLAYLAFTIVTFFIGLYCFSGGLKYLIIVVVIAELAFLFELTRLKQNLVLGEYGDPSMSQTPHNEDNFKTTRYLMFKKELTDKAANETDVRGCFELIDLQIDAVDFSGINVKRTATFCVGILVGILGAFWRTLTVPDLIISSLTVISVGLLVGFLISLFPSRPEQLNEMKYFMALYCRENKHSEGWA